MMMMMFQVRLPNRRPKPTCDPLDPFLKAHESFDRDSRVLSVVKTRVPMHISRASLRWATACVPFVYPITFHTLASLPTARVSSFRYSCYCLSTEIKTFHAIMDTVCSLRSSSWVFTPYLPLCWIPSCGWIILLAQLREAPARVIISSPRCCITQWWLDMDNSGVSWRLMPRQKSIMPPSWVCFKSSMSSFRISCFSVSSDLMMWIIGFSWASRFAESFFVTRNGRMISGATYSDLGSVIVGQTSCLSVFIFTIIGHPPTLNHQTLLRFFSLRTSRVLFQTRSCRQKPIRLMAETQLMLEQRSSVREFDVLEWILVSNSWPRFCFRRYH